MVTWLVVQIEKEVEGLDEKQGTLILKEITDDSQKVYTCHHPGFWEGGGAKWAMINSKISKSHNAGLSQ